MDNRRWHGGDTAAIHDYEATREAAMAAFAKSWRRQWPHISPQSWLG